MDTELRTSFRRAFLIKLLASIVLGLVYQFYFESGDTFGYFRHSKFLHDQIIASPEKIFTYLFASEAQFNSLFEGYISNQFEGFYFFQTSNLVVIKLAAIGNILTFNNYYGTALLFATFSFYGMWQFFKVFYKAYPDIGKKFWIIFYIPSVLFWGSGILKDAFCMGAIGTVVYLVDSIRFNRKKIILKTGIILSLLYLLWIIKPYIVICLLPALLLWQYFFAIKSFLKKISLFKIIVCNVVVLFILYKITNIKVFLQSISLDDIYVLVVKNRIAFEGATEEDGSFFSLGDFSPTITGFLGQIPKSINAVLFRPYLWETKKAFNMLAALEGLFLFVIFFIVLFKGGLVKSIRRIFTNPDIFFCFFFSLLFAAALGMNVSNFGALVRFKIQFLPFLAIAMILIYYKKDERNTLK